MQRRRRGLFAALDNPLGPTAPNVVVHGMDITRRILSFAANGASASVGSSAFARLTAREWTRYWIGKVT